MRPNGQKAPLRGLVAAALAILVLAAPAEAVIVGFNPQPDPPGVAVTLEVFSMLTGHTTIHVGNPDELPGS